MNRSIVVLAAVVLVASACDLEQDDAAPACVPDADEPDDPNASVGIGTIQDDPGVFSSSKVPQTIRVGRSLDHDGDTDRVTVMVQDTGAGGNPTVSIILSKGFKGTIHPSCTNGSTDSVKCSTGEALPDGHGCATTVTGNNAPQSTFSVECGGTPTDSLAVGILIERDGAPGGCVRYGVTASAN